MKHFFSIIFIFTFSVCYCFAYDTPDFFDAKLEQSALQFNKIKNHETFKSKKNHKINWTYIAADKAKYAKPLGTVIISPGRTESSLNWMEYSLALRNKGYSVAIIDHLGQGQSERLTPQSDKGHIDFFETYVEDFNLFLSRVKHRLAGPYFLIANSMGAPIALLADTSAIEKIILHAPMFKIKTAPLPYFLGSFFSKILNDLGQSEKYAPMTGSYAPAPFSDNTFATSKARYEFDVSLLKKNPSFIVGGPTVQWVNEALRVPELVKKSFQKIRTPILLFQADEENFVDNEIQSKLCSSNSNCQLIMWPKSKHVLHLEEDPTLNALFSKTMDFLKN